MTPIRVQSGLPGLVDLGAYVFLHLTFVPEPQAAVLLAVRLAALGAARRRRSPAGNWVDRAAGPP